jgi:hypothetical protein
MLHLLGSNVRGPGRTAGRGCRRGFGGGLEIVEQAGPERIEVRLERRHAGRVDLVDALRAGMAVADQAGVLEDAQVL